MQEARVSKAFWLVSLCLLTALEMNADFINRYIWYVWRGI
jgi:hypothetical protein